MKKYQVTWQKKSKCLPMQRKTVVTANSDMDARDALYRNFGSGTQVEILSVEELAEEGDDSG